MADLDIFSVPANVKLYYLPFTLRPTLNPLNFNHRGNNPDVFSVYGPINPNATTLYFTFKPAIYSLGYTGTSDVAYINIMPSSLRQFTNNNIANTPDISYKLTYNYDVTAHGDASKNANQNASNKSSSIGEVLNNIPSILIREYLIDSRIDQVVDIFSSFSSGFKLGYDEEVSDADALKFADESTIVSKDGRTLKTIDYDKWKSYTKKVLANFSTYAKAVINGIGEGLYKSVDEFPFPSNNVYYHRNRSESDHRFSYVLKIPYIMYYSLVGSTTTNIYEIPYNGKALYTSDGTTGWATSNSVQLLGLGKGILGAVLQYLGKNLRINTLPTWEGVADSKGVDVEVTFDLYNDTEENALFNMIFVNTLIPGNLWVQYHAFLHTPNLYDIKIEGYNRLFMCSGKFDVKQKGVMRLPSNSFFNLLRKHFNACMYNDNYFKLKRQVEQLNVCLRLFNEAKKQISTLEELARRKKNKFEADNKQLSALVDMNTHDNSLSSNYDNIYEPYLIVHDVLPLIKTYCLGKGLIKFHEFLKNVYENEQLTLAYFITLLECLDSFGINAADMCTLLKQRCDDELKKFYSDKFYIAKAESSFDLFKLTIVSVIAANNKNISDDMHKLKFVLKYNAGFEILPIDENGIVSFLDVAKIGILTVKSTLHAYSSLLDDKLFNEDDGHSAIWKYVVESLYEYLQILKLGSKPGSDCENVYKAAVLINGSFDIMNADFSLVFDNEWGRDQINDIINNTVSAISEAVRAYKNTIDRYVNDITNSIEPLFSSETETLIPGDINASYEKSHEYCVGKLKMFSEYDIETSEDETSEVESLELLKDFTSSIEADYFITYFNDRIEILTTIANRINELIIGIEVNCDNFFTFNDKTYAYECAKHLALGENELVFPIDCIDYAATKMVLENVDILKNSLKFLYSMYYYIEWNLPSGASNESILKNFILAFDESLRSFYEYKPLSDGILLTTIKNLESVKTKLGDAYIELVKKFGATDISFDIARTQIVVLNALKMAKHDSLTTIFDVFDEIVGSNNSYNDILEIAKNEDELFDATKLKEFRKSLFPSINDDVAKRKMLVSSGLYSLYAYDLMHAINSKSAWNSTTPIEADVLNGLMIFDVGRFKPYIETKFDGFEKTYEDYAWGRNAISSNYHDMRSNVSNYSKNVLTAIANDLCVTILSVSGIVDVDVKDILSSTYKYATISAVTYLSDLTACMSADVAKHKPDPHVLAKEIIDACKAVKLNPDDHLSEENKFLLNYIKTVPEMIELLTALSDESLFEISSSISSSVDELSVYMLSSMPNSMITDMNNIESCFNNLKNSMALLYDMEESYYYDEIDNVINAAESDIDAYNDALYENYNKFNKPSDIVADICAKSVSLSSKVVLNKFFKNVPLGGGFYEYHRIDWQALFGDKYYDAHKL